MLITTSATYDIAKWTLPGARLYDGLESWSGFEYEGPVALAGGGPTSAQNRAVDAQTGINQQLADVAAKNENYTEAQRNKTTPFYTNMMTNGPGYYNAVMDSGSGVNARAYAPAEAAMERSLGASTGLPSGYRDQARTDFNEARAQGFDSNIMGALADKQATQERGAAGLMGEAQQSNPLGYYQGASQGNGTIINANLRRPGLGGVLGGLFGGAMSFIPKGGGGGSGYADPSNPAFSTNLFPGGYT